MMGQFNKTQFNFTLEKISKSSFIIKKNQTKSTHQLGIDSTPTERNDSISSKCEHVIQYAMKDNNFPWKNCSDIELFGHRKKNSVIALLPNKWS